MKKRSAIKIWASILIFISAYIPLFIIMIIKDMDSKKNYALQNPYMSYFFLALIIFSSIFLYFVIKDLQQGGFEITITSVKHKSSEIVNYTIPYMISFFAFDMSKLQDLVVFAIFLILLCILSIRSQSIFINPILAVFGYGLYDCVFKENDIEKDGIIISKNDLLKETEYKIKKLSRYISIVSEYPEEC